MSHDYSTPKSHNKYSDLLESSMNNFARRYSTEASVSQIRDKQQSRRQAIKKLSFQQEHNIHRYGAVAKNIHQASSRGSFSPNKSKVDVVSRMSTKSYGKVIGYGWSQTKMEENAQQFQFDINLGPVKSFLLIQSTNSQIDMKRYCQHFSILLANLSQKFNNIVKPAQIRQIINECFSQSGPDNKISLISVVQCEQNIIIASIGELHAIYFTKDMLLLSTNEFVQNAQKNPQKNPQSPKYQRAKHIRFRSQQNTSCLGYNQKYKVKIKTLQCPQILWIALSTHTILQKCSRLFIKSCINQQIVTGGQFCTGQPAMQSSKKIINEMILNNNYNSMGILVILFSKYPNSIHKSDGKKSILSQMKTALKNPNIPIKEEDTKPKILKYIGNRKSFLKYARTKQQKIQPGTLINQSYFLSKPKPKFNNLFLSV